MFIVLDFIPRVQKFKELLTFRSFKTSTWVEKDDQNLKDQKIIKKKKRNKLPKYIKFLYSALCIIPIKRWVQ